MTLKIEVEIPYEEVASGLAGAYLANALSAIGYARETTPTPESATLLPPNEQDPAAEAQPAPEPPKDEAAAPAFRERNRPGEGRARRTKEEIAEDKVLDDLAAKLGVTEDNVDQMLAKHGHAATIETLKTSGLEAEEQEPARNISANPEHRTNPEDEAQDKADEAAEVEASRNPEKPLTGDDLRAAMGRYVQAHGMPATQEDGPKIFRAALGEPPEGQDGWRVSLVEDQDQETLKKAVEAWSAAVEAGERFEAS